MTIRSVYSETRAIGLVHMLTVTAMETEYEALAWIICCEISLVNYCYRSTSTLYFIDYKYHFRLYATEVLQ